MNTGDASRLFLLRLLLQQKQEGMSHWLEGKEQKQLLSLYSVFGLFCFFLFFPFFFSFVILRSFFVAFKESFTDCVLFLPRPPQLKGITLESAINAVVLFPPPLTSYCCDLSYKTINDKGSSTQSKVLCQDNNLSFSVPSKRHP